MSLQGTLETIPLADVLSLLAATKKTGELRVGGSRGDGRLWLDGGKVVAADVPRAVTPVDAVFELLRLTTGSFSFEDDAVGPPPGAPLAVDALLGEAQGRLEAWRAIEAVVPSMACVVALAPELAQDSVTVSRRQWKDLVAVAAGGDVNGVMVRLGQGEFDTCRTVKELVDAGLAKVAPAPVTTAPKPAEATTSASGRSDGPSGRTTPGDDTASARPAGATNGGVAPAARPAAPPPQGTPRARTPAAPAAGPARRPATPPAPGASASPDPARGSDDTKDARRPAPAPPSREEAEELVHQLASLSRTPPPPRPSNPKAEPSAPAAASADDTAAAPAGDNVPPAPARPDEEPINRGMLLKFLSSVRP